MMFRIFSLDNDIVLDKHYINVLEVHDKSFAVKIIKKLICEEDIYDDEFLILLDKDKEINLQKNSIVITDLFSINFNDKKITNKLYSLLEDEIKMDESFYIELNEINQLISNLLKDKINQSNFDLELEQELKIKGLLKHYNVKISQNKEDNSLNDLFNYLDLIIELNLCKIIFVVNLKSYLNDEQLKEAYKYFLYKKVNILLIETNKYEKLANEKKLIIDEFFDDYYV
ncbi:MAG TPA: type II-A CRISPR-associated protein Csn2 [Gallicola sp.]|nr:type II-A CRISPR-associated protein Csn2 [Gallicola sp.]